MIALLRDWKPGKRLSARARRKAMSLGHSLPRFKVSPHEAEDSPDWQCIYFAECRRCGRGVILDMDDPDDHKFYGPAVDDRFGPCPGHH